MIRAILTVAVVAALPMAANSARPGQIRLTPSDIATLDRGAGGPGTSGARGIETIVLAGDPTKAAPYTIELRVPAHTSIAAHTHRDDRTAVVVAGTWHFGYGPATSLTATKALGPGSFYSEPADDAHFAITEDEPVTVIISGFGPTDTHFVTTPGGA